MRRPPRRWREVLARSQGTKSANPPRVLQHEEVDRDRPRVHRDRVRAGGGRAVLLLRESRPRDGADPRSIRVAPNRIDPRRGRQEQELGLTDPCISGNVAAVDGLGPPEQRS